MLIFKAPQAQVLAALQSVAGIVERRHTMPILANVLLRKQGELLELVTSDLEVQISTQAQLGGDVDSGYQTTVQIRKLIDILRTMPSDQVVSLQDSDGRLVLKGGKSRFTLQTLPGKDFPLVQEAPGFSAAFSVPQKVLKNLLAQVSFVMPVQHVRYVLNGMLFQAEGRQLSLVATDGHRLAMTRAELDTDVPHQKVILPRKTVLELQRLLHDADGDIQMQFAGNQAKFAFGGMTFVTKLVEGQFPDSQSLVPHDNHQVLTLGRAPLLAMLQRIAILIHDSKFKGVRLTISPTTLQVTGTNNEQEEAVDELDVEYTGEPLEISFNVNYLLDVLSNMPHEMVRIALRNDHMPALVTFDGHEHFQYIVMTLRM